MVREGETHEVMKLTVEHAALHARVRMTDGAALVL